jgi:acyl carrier protein
MRAPSRLIPPRSEKDISWVWLLGALLAGFGYFVYFSSNTARYVTALLILAFCVSVAVINKREKRRVEGICSTRDEESICTFARSFSTRHVDTWVIRAAHQEIQQLMKSYIPAFPVRASDSLLNDLHVDSDDIEDLLVDIAARSGHSLDDTEKNPLYGKINTVRDLVLFVNAQPRLTTIRPPA